MRERDFAFFTGPRDTGFPFFTGYGISHFARNHGIIPNPVQSRGQNPGEGPGSYESRYSGIPGTGLLRTSYLFVFGVSG